MIAEESQASACHAAAGPQRSRHSPDPSMNMAGSRAGPKASVPAAVLAVVQDPSAASAEIAADHPRAGCTVGLVGILRPRIRSWRAQRMWDTISFAVLLNLPR